MKFIPKLLSSAVTTQQTTAPEATNNQMYSKLESIESTVKEANTRLDSMESVVLAMQSQTTELAHTTNELSKTNASLSTLVEIMKGRD